MSTNYVNIKKEDMESLIIPQGFKPVSLDNTVELVYGKRVDQEDLQLCLRLYSGINPDGNSRGLGEDAIRLYLFMKKDDKVVKIGGSPRVNRVVNWRVNLQKRIDSWLDYFPKKKCSRCNMPMIERKGQHGVFFGCCMYPVCKNTTPINNEVKNA
jgi:hypothetical protein